LPGGPGGKVVVADKLTWDEIKKHYPDEWVVLVDFVDGEDEVSEGALFFHSKDRDAAYDRCRSAPSPFAIRFTGKVRGGLIGFYGEDLEDQN
jgi:hypothetical protein